MEILIDGASWLLLITGGMLGIVGGIGIHRLPDFFTRLHAASVTDTLCAGLIFAGLILQEGFTLDSVRMFFIFFFLLYTSPIAAHALARAALHGGVKPKLSETDEETPSSKS